MDTLRALDAGLLPLERDVQPLHVGTALVFDGPSPSFDELRAYVGNALVLTPSHRCRVQRLPLDLGRPVWVEDSGFDLDDHLLHVAVPAPLDDVALRAVVVRSLETPLAVDRSPWRIWHVEGADDGRWALVVAAHHVLVDGVLGTALVRALLKDPTRRPAPAVRAPARLRSVALAARGATWAVRLPYRVGGALGTAARDPRTARRRIALVRGGLEQVVHRDLPATPFQGPLGCRRSWTSLTLGLADLEATGTAAGGTVNDVFLAALAGAYRGRLLDEGVSPDDVAVRTLVPVSRRTSDSDLRTGTIVGAFFVELPIGVEDPERRLALVVEQSRVAKATAVPAATEALLRSADHVPAPLLMRAFRAYGVHGQRRVNSCATNVHGPDSRLSLLGRPLVAMAPFVPVALDVRVTAALASYAGTATIGITADHDGFADLDGFADGLAAAFDELGAPFGRVG